MSEQPNIYVVVGANYGDEGKGREVSRLTRTASDPARTVVVRYNSSAQAGHTVVSGDKRHVFSHFGSGTLDGAATALTHRFIAVPTAFRREHSALVALGITPRVFLSLSINLATPLDALLNQLSERARGSAKHGSCGLGFGEVIRRQQDAGLSVNFYDFAGGDLVARDKTLGQLERYALERIGELNALDHLTQAELVAVNALRRGEFNWEPWLEAVEFMKKRCEHRLLGTPPPEYLGKGGRVIFEGAQGLLLHESLPEPYAPHVTWCRTGAEDALDLMTQVPIWNLEGKPVCVHYCSRTYLTRHGAGPLPSEVAERNLSGVRVVDSTNVENEHQGKLRFAPLNAERLLSRIDRDLRAAREYSRFKSTRDRVSASLVLTHCDQTLAVHLGRLIGEVKATNYPLSELILGHGADAAETAILNLKNWRTDLGTPVDPEDTVTAEPVVDADAAPQQEEEAPAEA